MIYIILSILANVGILFCFKAFAHFRLSTLQAIVFNYIVCIITGVLFVDDYQLLSSIDPTETWVILASILGIIFIIGFYLIAITTQRMGMTVASVASKMSLIIPVLISMLVLQIQSKDYSIVNYIGIFIALIAVVLSSIKKRDKSKRAPVSYGALLLPFSVFLFGGMVDTSLNIINYKFITKGEEAILPIVIFFSAFVVGAIVVLMRKEKIEFKNLVGGIVLGVINYFSIYFLVKGLSSFNNDGALVYPILNVGIILLSALFSVILFKEKLLRVNKLGLLLAVIAIFSIFYQEIISYLN